MRSGTFYISFLTTHNSINCLKNKNMVILLRKGEPYENNKKN